MISPVGSLIFPKLAQFKSWVPNAILLRTSILENWNYCYKIRNIQQSHHRCLHNSTARYNNPSYEPDGKTTVTILNDEHGAPLMVDSYTQHGFKLNNGLQVLGPMVIFPRTVLGWDVGGVRDITPSSLALFAVLQPKPDVLVIGIGDAGEKMPIETIQFLKKMKINIEILATEHACTTFNFLSGEGRCAVGVMIPPTRIAWTGFDIANTKRMKRNLYADDNDPLPPETGKTKAD